MSNLQYIKTLLQPIGPHSPSVAAKKEGAKKVLVIERDESIGGVLQQCIHPGFGLTYFVEKMLQTKIIHNENRFPYAINNKKKIKYWKWYLDNPYLFSGGIVSNIQDMLKYINIQVESEEAYIKNAHVLSEEIESYNNIRICKGWHTYQKSHQLWHVGGVGTFRSSIIVNKHHKNGVIVLGNTKGIKKANIHYLAKMIYSELKIKKIET